MKTYNNYIVLLVICLCNTFKAQVTITNNLVPKIAPNSDLKLEIKLNKGAISNFSKFQIDVPNGITVTEGDSKTGNFTFENNRAKIVWVSIPTEPEFIISMKLNTGNVSGTQQFFQKFFYLDNGVKKEVEIDAQSITFATDGVKTLNNIDNTTIASSNNNNSISNSNNTEATTVTTTTVTTTTTTTTNIENNTAVNTTSQSTSTQSVAVNTTTTSNSTAVVNNNTNATSTANNTTNSSSSNTTTNAASNYNYKVQIGAFTMSPQKSQFKSAGQIQVVNESGMFKVLVGNFTSKDEAYKKLSSLKSSGFDGFVVTYQNGSRVK
ncbi:MAG: SPOR domain-containing protein [Bacteroidetes bacterium]|nr:SPOR domain-containing protein [Bacteroidota bacterium]